MLAEQRRAIILETLAQSGQSVLVTELSRLFQVSTMTIRRDLDLLEAAGQVRRVHGGAVAALPREDTGQPFVKRSAERGPQKQAIGQLAASLVQDGDRILVDAGTTTLAMAERLGCLKRLTVITHALPVALALCASENVSTLVLGGILKQKEQCAVGPMVAQALERFSVDKVFLSAAGFETEKGLSDPDLMEAEVKQAMIGAARQVILLADSRKWGQVHLVQIAPWSQIHTLVSDSGLPLPARQALTDLGVQVLIAD